VKLTILVPEHFSAWLDRHERLCLFALFAAAAAALAIHALSLPFEHAGADGLKYERLGAHAALAPGILDCDNFQHAYWPPGWIITVGVLYKMFGPSGTLLRLFQIAVALATAWLIHWVAARMAGRLPAWLASAFFLLSSLVFTFTTFYQYDLLLGFMLFLSGAVLFAGGARRKAALHGACSGISLAFAALLSPKVLAAAPIFALASFRGRSRRGALAAIGGFVAGIALVIAPWSIHNYRCTGEVILVTTNGGINLYIGNNPFSTGGYRLPPEGSRPPYELHESAKWRREALRYMREHPGVTLRRTATKALLFWNPHFGDQALLIAAFALGLVRLALRRVLSSPPILWVWLLPFILMAVHMFFFVDPRYFVGTLPSVATIAGVGAAGFFRQTRAVPDVH